MVLAICTTQTKKKVKKRLKEKRKKEKKGDYDYEKFAIRGFEPGNSYELGLEGNASTHWTTSVNAENLYKLKRDIYSSSMVIDSFQGRLFVFFLFLLFFSISV